MSEETKKQPETEQEQAAAETKAPAAESDKQEAEPAAEKTEKKDWFGKKSKELEAVKAKLEAAEQANAKLKDQMLRTAAEYDNYRKRSAREADQKFNDGVSAYLRTCAGTRRIKHHDIGFGQIVAYVGKRLGHIAHTGVDIVQMDGPQIALRVFDSGLTTFHAQHARAAGA